MGKCSLDCVEIPANEWAPSLSHDIAELPDGFYAYVCPSPAGRDLMPTKNTEPDSPTKCTGSRSQTSKNSVKDIRGYSFIKGKLTFSKLPFWSSQQVPIFFRQAQDSHSNKTVLSFLRSGIDILFAFNSLTHIFSWNSIALSNTAVTREIRNLSQFILLRKQRPQS